MSRAMWIVAIVLGLGMGTYVGVSLKPVQTTKIERPPPLKEFIKNCPSPIMDDNCYILMIQYIQQLHDCIDKLESKIGN